MTITEFKRYIESLYLKEKDDHTKKILDDLWRKVPSRCCGCRSDDERWEDLHG